MPTNGQKSNDAQRWSKRSDHGQIGSRSNSNGQIVMRTVNAGLGRAGGPVGGPAEPALAEVLGAQLEDPLDLQSKCGQILVKLVKLWSKCGQICAEVRTFFARSPRICWTCGQTVVKLLTV